MGALLTRLTAREEQTFHRAMRSGTFHDYQEWEIATANLRRVTLSPFTRRALARELPALDTSGLVRQGGAL